MDLWEAIRSGSLENLKTTMKRPSSRQELMAQNAKNSAGLLMLAAEIGETSMLEYLADTIKKRLGMPQLAKQLRFEDAYKEPLMFYAAKSSPTMFEAVQKLVRDTIGEVGLTEQLRHRSARGIDILMKSCNDPITFEKVWDVLDQADCLEELRRDGKDKDGKSWIHHAAEAGNSAAFSRFDDDLSSLLKEFSSEDSKGWSGFMYAARGRRESNESFLKELCGYAKPADDLDIESQLKEQLTRVARDSDKSTLLMHAAIGGQKQFDTVRSLMCDTGCDVWNGKHDITAAMLLSWASKGGDIDVFERVAQGIKTGRFPDANNPGESWYICSAAENLADAIKQCAKEKGRSLFLSAVESDNEEMINSVGEGIVHIFKDPKECWTMLCGTGGNPVSLAAGKSVKSFEATLKFLQDKAKGLDQRGELKPGIMELLVSDVSPVCNAAISEDPDLFDKVWRRTNEILSQTPHNGSKDGSMILRHLDHLMMPDDQPGSVREKQISAKMLGRVLKAAKEADKNSGRFHTNTLDSFMTGAVSRGAFGHISELLKVGYDLEAHFPSVLDRIGKDEINTSQCMILAITTASNPFREYAIATKAIYDAMEKRSRDYAALDRLQQKIGDLKLDLLYHLPHSVGGFGEELSRGNPDFDPFDREPIGSVEPKRTLGFVLVRWILEDRAHSSHIGDSESGLLEGENSLVQAARSGPRALDFFSESLVVDYLRLNFSRTLPDWDTQKPFKHNINQAFYSYTQYARKSESSTTSRSHHGTFQHLFLWVATRACTGRFIGRKYDPAASSL